MWVTGVGVQEFLKRSVLHGDLGQQRLQRAALSHQVGLPSLRHCQTSVQHLLPRHEVLQRSILPWSQRRGVGGWRTPRLDSGTRTWCRDRAVPGAGRATRRYARRLQFGGDAT